MSFLKDLLLFCCLILFVVSSSFSLVFSFVISFQKLFCVREDTLVSPFLIDIFKESFRINKVEMSCLTKSSSASCSPDEKHVKQINGLFE